VALGKEEATHEVDPEIIAEMPKVKKIRLS
jgi:hypothetical protein